MYRVSRVAERFSSILCSNRDGEEWIHFRKILNKVMLVPDAMNLMTEPCQEVANSLRQNWQKQIETDTIIPDLQIQLYQWSIEGKNKLYLEIVE